MAYVSLYRKYRSQTFDEVVGQDHITTTLANAITEDKLHHAYLFTGPRGTGKTSTARILAKAVNCEKGPTATPCNVCEQCVAITAGSSIDVIEIDAASHGGVDDVRDLRERVAFAPASARMKVYIVDECHMLSTAGWNAFLKTVEEPPGHVLFVFATTEPHKVLPTILSRTQRFDFKRIPAEALTAHLERVAASEGVTIGAGALDLVVRAGDGSARDSLSLLEQVIAYTGREITAEGVTEVLGSVSDEHLHEFADLLAAGDVPGIVRLVGQLADAGQDLRQLSRDVVEHLRRVFLVQAAPDAGLVDGTPEQLARLVEQAGRFGRAELLRAIELVAEAQAQMRRGHVRLPLELALCKAAMPEAAVDPDAVAARLERLERGAPAKTAPPPAARAEEVVLAEADGDVIDLESPAPPIGEPPASAPQSSPEAGDMPLERVQERWADVLDQAKRASRRFHAFLSVGRPGSVQAGNLVVEFGPNASFHAEQVGSDEWRETLEGVVAKVLGEPLRVRCVVTDRDPTPTMGPDEGRRDEASDVLETEAAEAAGELPDDDEAHDQALETLTRDLGARVVEE